MLNVKFMNIQVLGVDLILHNKAFTNVLKSVMSIKFINVQGFCSTIVYILQRQMIRM